MTSQTAGVVRQALCMMILECPMDDGGGNVDAKRQHACASLIEAWCSPLLSASNGPPSRRLTCLPALTQVLNYFSDHPTHTKKLLANAIEVRIRSGRKYVIYKIYFYLWNSILAARASGSRSISKLLSRNRLQRR